MDYIKDNPGLVLVMIGVVYVVGVVVTGLMMTIADILDAFFGMFLGGSSHGQRNAAWAFAWPFLLIGGLCRGVFELFACCGRGAVRLLKSSPW